MADRAAIEEALRLLIDYAAERVERDPAGYLLRTREESIALRLGLPLSPDAAQIEALAESAGELIDRSLEALIAHRAAFRPGRVFCLRCNSAECQHAQPLSCRLVFSGYSPSGIPSFIDLGELLLTRQDPRVGELFAEENTLVTHVMEGRELTERLLPAFRHAGRSYRIHGQVVAGWYRLPDPSGRRRALALTFQVVSSRFRGAPPRWGLNVLGGGPEGEPLTHLHDRMGAIPWTGAVRWAQSILRGTKGLTPRRTLGLLGGLARRLERGQRSQGRRTAHAQRRHSDGERPTRMALLDLQRAGPEGLLFDTRARTLVVLGERGRCHVFNPAGKLVTSLRCPQTTIERRLNTGKWQPATAEQVDRLRRRTSSGISEEK